MSTVCVDRSAPDVCLNMSASFSTATAAMRVNKDFRPISSLRDRRAEARRRTNLVQRPQHPRRDAMGLLDRKPETIRRRDLLILGAVEAEIGALARTLGFTNDACGSKSRAGSVFSHCPPSQPSETQRRPRRLRRDDANYRGGLWWAREIVDAVRDLIRAKVRDGLGLDELAEQITPAAIDQYLYTVGLPEPDLIIRTSGEVRFSRLSLMAERPKRILLHGRLLAGVPQSRLPARDPHVPAEDATLRAVRRATG